MDSTRRTKLLDMYKRVYKPHIEFFKRGFPPGRTLIDIGCGEGLIALEAAKDLEAGKVILVDHEDQLAVPLPTNATLEIADICRPRALEKHRNVPRLALCTQSFHEFNIPDQAFLNMVSILPIGSALLIADYSGPGLIHAGELAEQGTVLNQIHHADDMVRTQINGIDTDEGIRRFWEEMFTRVPGDCKIAFCGHIYFVLYVPRQWYEVKEPPAQFRHLIPRPGHA